MTEPPESFPIRCRSSEPRFRFQRAFHVRNRVAFNLNHQRRLMRIRQDLKRPAIEILKHPQSREPAPTVHSIQRALLSSEKYDSSKNLARRRKQLKLRLRDHAE